MIESAEEFLRLRHSEDPEEYGRASRECAPLGVWLDLANRFPEARIWIARNKSVPIEVLALLAGDENPEVRLAVASKRKATQEILEQLASDTDESVRLKVAAHKNAPPEAIEALRNDPCARVREVARERDSGAE